MPSQFLRPYLLLPHLFSAEPGLEKASIRPRPRARRVWRDEWRAWLVCLNQARKIDTLRVHARSDRLIKTVGEGCLVRPGIAGFSLGERQHCPAH